MRVPVGEDAARWQTFDGRRTVVAAARTVTSTARLLEVLPALLRGDPRVTVVFAYDASSAFSDGVLGLLTEAGCRTVPWSQVAAIAPALIISASENIDVPAGDCPVLVLPHGVGFQKMVPDSRAPRLRPSGVVPDALMESGRAWLAVSHPDQERQVVAVQPKADGRTLLVGDPVLDDLLASVPHAARYKQALDVDAHQRLVVLSSTWGRTSLLGRRPGLPGELLARLPYDQYRVAAIVHPNVWAGHGAWQVRTLLADALDAGLLLMPPVHAWRCALVAADAVIGDHGSVTLYAAALGKPLLLGAFGQESLPGTAIARLRQEVDDLDPWTDMHVQIERTLARHSNGLSAELTAGAFASPGGALRNLQAAVYDFLHLSEPPGRAPRSRAMPTAPSPATTAVTSWMVETAVSVVDGRHMVDVRRFPAAVDAGDRDEAADVFLHLAADEAEADPRLSESASVILSERPAASPVAARRWAQTALSRFPGSYVVACAVDGGGHLITVRGGPTVEASMTGRGGDIGLAAAAVYACLRAGFELDDAVLTVSVDARDDTDVMLRVRAGGPREQ